MLKRTFHPPSRRIAGMVISSLLLLLLLNLPGSQAATTPNSTLVPNVSNALSTLGHPAVVDDGGHLALQSAVTEVPYDFTGINAYQLTSEWGANDGCGWGGWTPASLNQFFAQLPANAMVRTWFFQTDATQQVNGVSVRNWQALDQVIAAADQHNVHLVLTLGNQDGTCDDATWKGPAWYSGGFRTVPSGGPLAGPGKVSYAQWVQQAVSRYRANPAIAMWEPMNEPQPASCSASPGWNCWSQRSCPNEAVANQSLVTFYDTIGGEIHSLDPGKLVSDGSFGGGGCGTATNADFQKAIDSPGINVVGYHDYSGAVANPADLAPRDAEASQVGKPTMVGEAGVTGCASASQRASIYASKIAAAQKDGVSAYLAWWYDGDNGQPTCNSPIFPDAPAWGTILGAAHLTGLPQVAQVTPGLGQLGDPRLVQPGGQ